MILPNENYREEDDPMHPFNRTERVGNTSASGAMFEDIFGFSGQGFDHLNPKAVQTKVNSRNSRKLTDYEDKKHFATMDEGGANAGN